MTRLSLNTVTKKLPKVGQNTLGNFLPNFSVLRRKLVYSMYKRVLASSNSLVRTLLDSNFFVTSRIFKQWMQILFSNYVC